MNIVVKAEYLVELLKNNVSDQIRLNYKNTLKTTEDYAECFYNILDIIIKNIINNTYPIDAALTFTEIEFKAFNMEEYLGNYENYIPFIELLYNKAKSTENNNDFQQLKYYINIADSINYYEIKKGIYFAVLNFIITTSIFTGDLPFTKKLINFTKDAGIVQGISQLYYSLITKSFNYYY